MSCPVIELTQQLIRRPSLSPDDAGCQALMIERLRAIGFTVEHMDFGDTQNFWAWRGQGETLAFAGHTDVVPAGDADRWINPPFEPTIRDGMLFRTRRCGYERFPGCDGGGGRAFRRPASEP